MLEWVGEDFDPDFLDLDNINDCLLPGSGRDMGLAGGATKSVHILDSGVTSTSGEDRERV